MVGSDWQRARLGKIFKNLKGVDVIYIRNTQVQDPNFLYLTGFTSGLFEGTKLIATRKKTWLITSPLEYETALAQRPEGMKVIQYGGGAKSEKMLVSRLIRGKRVGANLSFLPFTYLKSIKEEFGARGVVDISNAMLGARLIKDESEIGKIRKAVKVTKRAMIEIQKYFKEGITELELAARFDFIQMSLGASGPSFKTIVCFGKNAAFPHHSPDNTRLKRGQFVLIDAGAVVDGYCSDITRTFMFKGASERQKEMFEVVKEAQLRAIAEMAPDKDGNQIYKNAKDFIDNAKGGKYMGRFIHSLGHSLGIEVHDGARLGGERTILASGMVMTVEPGIYVNGFGGVRIEDDVLITRRGIEIL